MIEVLKQALEALEYIDNVYMSVPKLGHEAITSLRQAIAKLESQEPVAMYREKCADGKRCLHGCHTNEPCYTRPPQRTWVGLTDEEISAIEDEYIVYQRIPAGSAWDFAKDIEAKLKEKNT